MTPNRYFEPAFEREGVALHVEEEVAGRRRGQRSEPALEPRRVGVGVGWRPLGLEHARRGGRLDASALHLELGLVAEPLERRVADAVDQCIRRVRGRGRWRCTRRRQELAGLVAAHAGDQGEVVVGAPLVGAHVGPAADAAVVDLIGIGARRRAASARARAPRSAP